MTLMPKLSSGSSSILKDTKSLSANVAGALVDLEVASTTAESLPVRKIVFFFVVSASDGRQKKRWKGFDWMQTRAGPVGVSKGGPDGKMMNRTGRLQTLLKKYKKFDSSRSRLAS